MLAVFPQRRVKRLPHRVISRRIGQFYKIANSGHVDFSHTLPLTLFMAPLRAFMIRSLLAGLLRPTFDAEKCGGFLYRLLGD